MMITSRLSSHFLFREIEDENENKRNRRILYFPNYAKFHIKTIYGSKVQSFPSPMMPVSSRTNDFLGRYDVWKKAVSTSPPCQA